MKSNDAKTPIPSPNPSIEYLEIFISCRPVDDGLTYVLNTSYVIRDETEINCAEPAAVTAVNKTVNMRIAPTSPKI